MDTLMDNARFRFRNMENSLIEMLEDEYTPKHNADDVDEFVESYMHEYIDSSVIYYADAWGMLRENPEHVSNSWGWILEEYGMEVDNVCQWAYWEFYHYLHNESNRLEKLRERLYIHLVS